MRYFGVGVRVVQLDAAVLALSLLYPAGTLLLAHLGVVRMPVPDSAYLPAEPIPRGVSNSEVFGPDMQTIEVARGVITSAAGGSLNETEPWRFNTRIASRSSQGATVEVSAWRPCAHASCEDSELEGRLAIVTLTSPSTGQGVDHRVGSSTRASSAVGFTATRSGTRWDIVLQLPPSDADM